MSSNRFPPWLVKRLPNPSNAHNVKSLMRSKNLHTVCEEAKCPNLFDCFSRGTATFMIAGDICTRTCGYCSVSKGMPFDLDLMEPFNVAETARIMKLKHVVVTMVNRDDLFDGASEHVANTVRAVRDKNPMAKIEVLVSDFLGDIKSVKTVVESGPDVFNHNMETVRRLFLRVRPNGDFNRSLEVLSVAKKLDPNIVTKSGVMVGLGEKEDDVYSLMDDLRDPQVSCDILTVGQYLQPQKKAIPVKEYIHPDVYNRYRIAAKEKGFSSVFAGPFVRSSYNAAEALELAQGEIEASSYDLEGKRYMTVNGLGENISPVDRKKQRVNFFSQVEYE
ncbi:MAG: lipoyl synthase [Nitrospinota bacterium]|nr:lipoyl synthase [Nitrospinota bacterium]